MQASDRASAFVAQGIQFSVLAHAFPVLRHDVLKPISNAKLAAAMMHRTSAESEPYSEHRTQQLLSDIDFMLDEGTETVRLLGEWLTDSGKRIKLDELVQDCVKLLFTHLLLSGKKISLAKGMRDLDVMLFSGRYVVLNWLLHIVQTMPHGSELVIERTRGRRVIARVHPGQGRPAVPERDGDLSPAIAWESVHDLSDYYGWSAQSGQSGWTLSLPPTES